MVNLLENRTALFCILFYTYSCFRINWVYFVVSILSLKMLKCNHLKSKISKFSGGIPPYPSTCAHHVTFIIRVGVVSRSACGDLTCRLSRPSSYRTESLINGSALSPSLRHVRPGRAHSLFHRPSRIAAPCRTGLSSTYISDNVYTNMEWTKNELRKSSILTEFLQRTITCWPGKTPRSRLGLRRWSRPLTCRTFGNVDGNPRPRPQ